MRHKRSRLRPILAASAMIISVASFILNTAPSSRLEAAAQTPTQRNERQWPFAWNSIWNLPVGDAARLVPAGIGTATGAGMTVDEDILILEPDAPQTDLQANTAGWNGSVTRCGTINSLNTVLRGVPIPDGFSTDPGYLGRTPNHSAALLMADGATVVQTQPFHRCGAGGVATSQYVFPSDNLKTGDGIRGAHGGSGMSSIGGTVRLGELVPGSTIRHALKININCAALCYYNPNETDGNPGYRWPAVAADSGAANRYKGTNPALQMGSLLALPPTFNIGALGTEPARILAQAMRDYGSYVVDDTGWDVYALETEWSPQGRVIDEFNTTWGFDMESPALRSCNPGQASCQWSADMADIYQALNVVDDNTAATTGGAGNRRTACAPAFTDGTGAAPNDCGPGSTTTTDTTTTGSPTTDTTAGPETTTSTSPDPTVTTSTGTDPGPSTPPTTLDGGHGGVVGPTSTQVSQYQPIPTAGSAPTTAPSTVPTSAGTASSGPPSATSTTSTTSPGSSTAGASAAVAPAVAGAAGQAGAASATTRTASGATATAWSGVDVVGGAVVERAVVGRALLGASALGQLAIDGRSSTEAVRLFATLTADVPVGLLS